MSSHPASDSSADARQHRAPGRPDARKGQSGREPWRLHNWSVRTKLIVVLLIPTVTAVVLIGMRFGSLVSDANGFDALSAQVKVDAAVSNVVHSLQSERRLSVQRAVDGTASPQLKAQYAKVDADATNFGRAIADVQPELPDATAKSLAGLKNQLDGLQRLRADVGRTQTSDDVMRPYGKLIGALIAERQALFAAINRGDLMRAGAAEMALARAQEQQSIASALIDEALHNGRLDPGHRRQVDQAVSESEAWTMDFDQFATPAQHAAYANTANGADLKTRDGMEKTILQRAESGQSLKNIDAARWARASSSAADKTRQVEIGVQRDMSKRTDDLASDANADALRDGLIVAFLLVVALCLAVLIGRSLVGPLRTLRKAAFDVAERRLPMAVQGILSSPQAADGPPKIAPVPVHSQEEVGQVARAFDAVHAEAVRQAAEQARLRSTVNEMFISLARRGQRLVDRQLGVLDRMEEAESDPDSLSALFELDHLATRSRRAFENLLVLTGNDYGREVPGPVAASEVIGAALSEIEEYRRVVLREAPDVALAGDAVSDVVHVLSELIENATHASDGDVLVSSWVDDHGRWLVEVADHGPGMPAKELERINHGLATVPETVDVRASSHMGFLVVARLAARHGITVRLRPGPSTGVVAGVLVPDGLITKKAVPAKPAAAQGRRPQWLDKADASSSDTPASDVPTRAPIVSPSVDRVAEPDRHPLEDETPTERMPAYRDLLTKFVRSEASGEVNGRPAERAADTARAAEPRESVPESPPQSSDGVNSDVAVGDDAEPVELPAERGSFDGQGSDQADSEEVANVPLDAVIDLVGSEHRVRNGLNAHSNSRVISRKPEDILDRIGGMMDGMQRARQQGGAGYSDSRGRARATRRPAEDMWSVPRPR